MFEVVGFIVAGVVGPVFAVFMVKVMVSAMRDAG